MSNIKLERMGKGSLSFLQTYIPDVFEDNMDAWKVSSKNSDIFRKSYGNYLVSCEFSDGPMMQWQPVMLTQLCVLSQKKKTEAWI